VPFLAVWFATTKGLKNARTFYSESQDKKTKSIQKAVVAEMVSNIYQLLDPYVAMCEDTVRAVPKTQGHVFDFRHLPHGNLSVRRDVYKECMSHLGEMAPNHIHLLIDFYNTLENVTDRMNMVRGLNERVPKAHELLTEIYAGISACSKMLNTFAHENLSAEDAAAITKKWDVLADQPKEGLYAVTNAMDAFVEKHRKIYKVPIPIPKFDPLWTLILNGTPNKNAIDDFLDRMQG